jgi:hypothetical protein
MVMRAGRQARPVRLAGRGAGCSLQVPTASRAAEYLRASSHVVAPVRRRWKRPARVPETKITHAHRFQPRARSSNSPEVEFSA